MPEKPGSHSMINSCNARVVSTPFGINGLECYDGNLSVNHPRVLNSATSRNETAVGGALGIRNLCNRNKEEMDFDKPIVLASLHHKGRLVVWDADTMDVLGTCDHSGASVIECVITPTYIYVRVENEGCLEDKEASIFIWHTKSLKLCDRVVAHDGRVTSFAVSDESDACFATAGVDQMVHLWDLAKDHMIPVQKIALKSSVTVSLYYAGKIFASYAGSPMVVWDAVSGKEVFRTKEESGRITLVRWINDPQRVKSKRRVAQDLSIIVGFNDGFIKEWSVHTAHSSSSSSSSVSLALKWAHKVHRSQIDDICGDDEVVLSCSALDGAFLLLPSTGNAASLFSYGARIGLLDTCSKLAIVGAEDGSVAVFSYAEFYMGRSVPGKLSVFRPHVGSVTGMFLQLQRNQKWDRLMCSSADGKLLFLDYSKSRCGSWIERVKSQTVDFIPRTGGIIVPQKDGKVSIVNRDTLAFSSKQPSLKLSKSVITVRWADAYNKLLLGYETGEIAVYECRIDNNNIVSFFKLEERGLSPYFVPLIALSEPSSHLAVACFRKETLHEGGFLVIDVEHADITFPLQYLQRSYAIRCSIIPLKDMEDCDYTVILLLRDGSILQYLGDAEERVDAVLTRTISNSQLPNVRSMELTGLSIFPSQYVLSVEQTTTDAPKITLIYAEGPHLKRATFSATAAGSVEVTDFAEKGANASQQTEEKKLGDVVCLTGIFQGDLGLAVVRDSPFVDLVSPGGEYLYRIWYGGDVLNYDMEGRRRRQLSFPFDPAILNEKKSLAMNSSCSACCVSFCAERRYLAIGYRDGTVQLFDTTQHVIFARFMAHTATVTSIWAFPHAMVSFSVDGSCYVGRVTRRVLFG